MPLRVPLQSKPVPCHCSPRSRIVVVLSCMKVRQAQGEGYPPDGGSRVASKEDAKRKCIAAMMNTCSADVLRSWYNLAAAARYTRMLLDYSREHGLTHWSEPGSRLQAILDSKGGDLDAQDCGGCTPALTRSPSITPAVGLLDERAEAFVRVGRIAEA